MTQRSGGYTALIGAFALILGTLPMAAPARSATLDDIRSRGVLNCGVSEGIPGFSLKAGDGSWTGLDIDFCRALAAAVLGDATKVSLLPTSAEDRFAALAKGTVDVLTRNTSWTFQREIENAVVFPGVLYFDGQGIMVPKELGLTSAVQLAGGKICVLENTTSQANAAAYFAKAGLGVELLTFPHRKEAVAAYEAGQCDARTADRSALFGERQLLSDPSRHMILTETISKEPLGPVVRAADPDWARVVRWVLFSLIAGEELEVTQAALQATANGKLSPDQKRFLDESGKLGSKIGLPPAWVATVITSVGNYGEIFDRNLGKASDIGMLRGANALWKDGGLLYAPPMP
jgi:general L-amino acid transport system substrate-binding protein